MKAFTRCVFMAFFTITCCAPPSAAGRSGHAQQVYKDSLNNAYELAQELAAFTVGNRALTVDERARCQALLGRIIWYADLQDSSDNVFDQLMIKVQRRYPALYTKVDALYGRLNNMDTLYKLDTMSFAALNTISSDPNNESRKNIVLAHRRYRQLRDTVANQRADIEGKLRIYKEKVQAADLALLDPETDTATRGKLAQDTASAGIALTALQKKLADSTEQLNEAKHKLDKAVDALTAKKSFIAVLNGTSAETDAKFGISEMSTQMLEEVRQTTNVMYTTQVMAPEAASYRMPSQSEMVDAVAIYIAKRIKQESVMWFFETVSKNAARYEMMQVFFPQTLKLLGGNEIYEIPNMGVQWKYALSQDFVRMPENVFKSQWLLNRWPDSRRYTSYVSGACDIANMLLSQKSYPEIIRTLYLEQPKTGSAGRVEFGDYVSLLYGINNELTAASGDSAGTLRMLKYEDYRAMSREQLELMLSLVDMKYGGVLHKLLQGMDTMRFNAVVTPERMRLLLGKIERTISNIETVRKDFVSEQQKDKEGNNLQQIAYTSLNIWSATSSLFNLFDSSLNPTPIFRPQPYGRQAFYYAGQLFEVYNLIAKKNYAGAVQRTLTMLDTIFYRQKGDSFQLSRFNIGRIAATLDSSTSTLLRKLVKSLDSGGQDLIDMQKQLGFSTSASGQTIYFKKASLTAAVIFENDRHAIQVLKKLAGFLNDAALSKDSKELAKAVESYAMPPGSYKRKRNCWWSADVNAFAGGYYGQEWLANGTAKLDNRSSVYGFSVPIGISLSKTLGAKIKKASMDREYILNPNRVKLCRDNIRYRTNNTFTLTFSIVDIGAVVSYRLGNNDSALPQEVKWEQFISPGLHIGYGLGSTPLVINAGFQYTPLLRRLEAPDGSDKQYNAYRVYLGLFYDLPLINMWERKRIVY